MSPRSARKPIKEFRFAQVLGRARLHRVRENSGSEGFWEGHDFSRAVKSSKISRALAPEDCLLLQNESETRAHPVRDGNLSAAPNKKMVPTTIL